MMMMQWGNNERTNENSKLRALFLRPNDPTKEQQQKKIKKNANKFLSPSQTSLSLSSVPRVFVCAVYKITSQNTKRD